MSSIASPKHGEVSPYTVGLRGRQLSAKVASGFRCAKFRVLDLTQSWGRAFRVAVRWTLDVESPCLSNSANRARMMSPP